MFPTFLKLFLGRMLEFIVKQKTCLPLNCTLGTRILLILVLCVEKNLLAASVLIWAAHSWTRAGIWGESREVCVWGSDHDLISAWNTLVGGGAALVLFAW